MPHRVDLSAVDARHRTPREAARAVRIIQPSLLRRSDVRTAVVCTRGSAAAVARARRATWTSCGLDAVVDELGCNVEPARPEALGRYDLALLPIMSVPDVLSAVTEIPRTRRVRVVAGGQGTYPVWALRHVADRICFGRAEDAVHNICLDADPLPYCYDCREDPDLRRRYVIRQASRLLPGEVGVGCPRACRFCQYTHTRRPYPAAGGAYAPGPGAAPESTLADFRPSGPGRYTVGLDGWSEESRRRVGKPMDDRRIAEVLRRITSEDWGRPVVVKVFQIVGYPWETPRSLADDVANMRRVLETADGCGRGRVVVMFLCTPFSPEPLTPMAREPACVEVDWRGVLEAVDRAVYCGERIEAFILPQVPSPLTLLRRVSVNRGLPIDRLVRLAGLPSSPWREVMPEALRLCDGIWERDAGRRVEDYLGMPAPRVGAEEAP